MLMTHKAIFWWEIHKKTMFFETIQRVTAGTKGRVPDPTIHAKAHPRRCRAHGPTCAS